MENFPVEDWDLPLQKLFMNVYERLRADMKVQGALKDAKSIQKPFVFGKLHMQILVDRSR